MGGCATKSWAQDEAPPPPLEEPPAGEEEKVAPGKGSVGNRPRSLGYLFKNEDNPGPSETENSIVAKTVTTTQMEKREESTEHKAVEAEETEQATKAEVNPGALEGSEPQLEAIPEATNKETSVLLMTSEAVVTNAEPLASKLMEEGQSIKVEPVELCGDTMTQVEKKEESTDPKAVEAEDTEQARKAEINPGALEGSKPQLDEAIPEATNKESSVLSMTSEVIVTNVESLASELMEETQSIKVEPVEVCGDVENREEGASMVERKLDQDVPLSTQSEVTQ